MTAAGVFSDYDCTDAGTFLYTNRPEVWAGLGPEPARCDEETGVA